MTWLLRLACRITIGVCAEILEATNPPPTHHVPDCWMCEFGGHDD